MFSSEPRTNPSVDWIPMMVAPRFTSSIAYSTWKGRPSGEKTVMARSYAPGAANTDIMLSSLYTIHFFTVSYNNYTKNLSYKSKIQVASLKEFKSDYNGEKR
jgi:hypothetical protein